MEANTNYCKLQEKEPEEDNKECGKDEADNN
jgi:hypothetical protein